MLRIMPSKTRSQTRLLAPRVQYLVAWSVDHPPTISSAKSKLARTRLQGLKNRQIRGDRAPSVACKSYAMVPYLASWPDESLKCR